MIVIFAILLVGILYAFFSDYIEYMFTGQITPKPTVTSTTDSSVTPNENVLPNTENNDKIIVMYQNEKYDITNFIKRHPGGKEILMNYNGKDIEKAMLENEHSESAYKILARYKIK